MEIWKVRTGKDLAELLVFSCANMETQWGPDCAFIPVSSIFETHTHTQKIIIDIANYVIHSAL